MNSRPKDRFELGEIYGTPGSNTQLTRHEIIAALERHVRRDWGDVCDEDRAENEFAVDKYLRIFSIYHSRKGIKFWIITEADRSVTTVLLPDEY